MIINEASVVIPLSVRDAIAAPNWLYTWDDLGPKLTCSESERLANLLDALDLSEHAVRLRESHAREDAPDDEHYAAPPVYPPADAKTCPHGYLAWVGNECGRCETEA